MKARYDGVKQATDSSQGEKMESYNRLLPPLYWRVLAVVLAIFCGIFLFLAYKEITSIELRKAELSLLEDRLLGGEQRLKELSATIGQMTSQRDALQGEIVKLESEAANNADSAAESRILSKTLPPLEEEYTQLLSKVADLREQKAALEVGYVNIKEKQTNIDAVFKKRSESLKALESELEKERSELSEIDKLFAEKQAAVAGITRSITDFEVQITSLKDSHEKLKKDVAELLTEKVEIQKSVAETKKTLAALEVTLSDVQMKHTESQQRYNAQEKNLQSLNSDLNKKNAELADIEKMLAEKQAAVAGATRSLADYQAQVETEKSAYEKYKGNTTKLQEEQASIEKAIVERESAIASLRIASSKVEAKADRVNSEFSEITKQFEAMRNESIELEKRKQLLVSEVARIAAKQNDIIVNINTSKKEMASLEIRLQSQKEKIEDVNQKVLQAEKRLNDKETIVGKIVAEIDSLESERLELLKAVSRLQGQEEALKKNLSAETVN
jgi:chromosome segregation ATPase